jgi:hypothetical protein
MESADRAREAVRRAPDGLRNRRHSSLLQQHFGVLGGPQRFARGVHVRGVRKAESEARELLTGVAVAV